MVNNRVGQDNDDLIEKLVTVRRVVKVVKGGRVFSFSALSVVGDGNGVIGYGTGKAKEVPTAIQKSIDNAKKAMRRAPITKGTLHYPIISEVGAAKIYMQPASEGTGVIAGGPMRAVFEAVGVRNILAKCNGTNNPISVVRATIEGLTKMSSPQQIAAKRGKSLDDIFAKGKKNITPSTEDTVEQGAK